MKQDISANEVSGVYLHVATKKTPLFSLVFEKAVIQLYAQLTTQMSAVWSSSSPYSAGEEVGGCVCVCV